MGDEELPILVDLHRNVFFDKEKGEVVILDRRKFPETIAEYRCKDFEEVARGIEKMVTQSLGVSPAAGYGVAIAAYEVQDKNETKIKKQISDAVERMKNTRPTQTSLHYLVDEMAEIANEAISEDRNVFEVLLKKAHDWTENIMDVSRKLGRHASNLLEDGDTILTHCYGGPAIFLMGSYAQSEGKEVDYFCTETRPYLQGARLTAHALTQGDFDVTLVTDGMGGFCMQNDLIDKFITGADRISMDGGVANKIGTYQIALASKKHEVPFYAISYTGPDGKTPTCKDIEIEKRDPQEVTHVGGNRITPPEVEAFYPAFDCTPPELVEGIITERGVYAPESVFEYFEKSR